MMETSLWIALLLGTLRFATPLLLAAMGGLFSEKSGVVQIGLEAYLLVGAFAGASIAFWTQSSSLGFVAAGFAGAALAALFGLFAITLKSNQIIAGLGVNIFAMGIIPILSKKFFDSTGSTPSIDLAIRFTAAPIFIALGCFVFTYLVFHHTVFGIRTTLVGEKPEVIESAGVSVAFHRWVCVLICGFLTGLGGASLSLFLSSQYSPMMSGGRGYMALAALILGRWRPLPTLLAVILFAFFDALQIRLQGMQTLIPLPVVQMLPYLLTILLVAGFFGKAKAPEAIGKT